MLLDVHFNSIVDALCNNGSALLKFVAGKLCEAGVISPAEQDLTERIECDLIRSKAIVGALVKVTRKAVRPNILLKKFLDVMQLNDLGDIIDYEFKGIIYTFDLLRNVIYTSKFVLFLLQQSMSYKSQVILLLLVRLLTKWHFMEHVSITLYFFPLLNNIIWFQKFYSQCSKRIRCECPLSQASLHST